LDDDDDTEDDSFGYEGEGDAATEDDLNEVVSDLDLECESVAPSHNSTELLQRCQVAATEIVSANVPAEDQSRNCIATQKVNQLKLKLNANIICIYFCAKFVRFCFFL